MWHRVLTFGAEGTEPGNFCRPWGVAIARYSESLVSNDPWSISDSSINMNNNDSSNTFNEWLRPVGVGFSDNAYYKQPINPAVGSNSHFANSSMSCVGSTYIIGIADRSNNRIQLFKFDASRRAVTFLHAFGDGPGTRHGQFDRPAGIVFNSKLEQIIVSDKDNHRVQVFDMAGTYLFKFGERGSKCGQFCYPWDIDVCKTTHNIVVSDTRNRRVQMFNNLGLYLAHFGQPLDSPRGVTYILPTKIVVSDFNKHRLVMITQSDEKTVTSSTSLISSSYGNDYLAGNSHQALQKPPINIGSRLINQQQQQQHQYHESKLIGFGEGSSCDEFLRPQGATYYGSTVYCADSRNNRIACWNKDTQTFNYISRDVVELDRPAGLAAIDNYLVIVDFGNNRIHVCQQSNQNNGYSFETTVQSATGACTWKRIVTFGTEGTETGNFCRPWGVAIARYSEHTSSTELWSNNHYDINSDDHKPIGASNNWLNQAGYSNFGPSINPAVGSQVSNLGSRQLTASYIIGIADRSNNRIQLFKFDASRRAVTFLHAFGDGPGTRHGQFDRPAGIVFNSKLEQIIVSDKDNHRVQVFDMAGTYLFKFGERGSKCGQFCYPWDIDVCKTTHNIVVSDTRNRRVQMFNNLGLYLAHFGQPLDSPRGVTYILPTKIVVSDFNKHRLVMITQSDEKTVTSSTSLISSSYGNDYLAGNSHQALQKPPINIGSRLISQQQHHHHHHHHQQLNQHQQLQQQQQQYHESKLIGFGEGSSWGEFLRPQGATYYGSTVYCADSRNNRIACWNKDTQTFNYISRDVVELDRPAGLAAIDNYLVIVDFGNNRIHVCQKLMSL